MRVIAWQHVFLDNVKEHFDTRSSDKHYQSAACTCNSSIRGSEMCCKARLVYVYNMCNMDSMKHASQQERKGNKE